MIRYKWIRLLLFAGLFIVEALQSNPLQLSAVPDQTAYAAGDTVIIAVNVKIEDQHHLYGNPLGPGIGLPLEIDVKNPGDIEWFSLKKENPKRFVPDFGDWVWAYEKEAVFFLFGRVSNHASGGQSVDISMNGLTCHTSCMPFDETITVSIAVEGSVSRAVSFSGNPRLAKILNAAVPMQMGAPSSDATGSETTAVETIQESEIQGKEQEVSETVSWDYQPQEKKRTFNIPLALLFAFIAGMILNVMPCVLPVLGIKILSFSQSREGSRSSAVIRSLVFASGMLLVFMLLATLAAFAGFSWGEQFQTPAFLVSIIGIIFVFALGMFDVFMILVPTQITGMEAQAKTRIVGLGDDFLKGMFATILATPCSGPLLGATLAWTLTQPTAIVYMVFAALGLGMAFPYILLASSKRLSRLIPKPGGWMSDFKHFMGFLLFGFAVYLMIGLPRDMVVSTVGLCVFLAFAVAFYSRFTPFGSVWLRKIGVGFLALFIAGLGWYLNFQLLYNSISDDALQKTSVEAADWQVFSADKLLDAQKDGQHVIVDFTANWCMNCQFNKITVLFSSEIRKMIEKKNIVPLKADLTAENPVAESLLHHLGSRSVPFLAVFDKKNPKRPIIMRDILNKKRVLQALADLSD